jgi:allantoinase
MPYDLLIRNAQVVTPSGVVPGDVAIEGGKFVEVGVVSFAKSRETIDASDLHLFPGVVDVHVHFNEPGRTEWEGAATGSAALAAGGGTTFCDMPLNSSPPTLDGPSFDLKRTALETHSHLDFGLWGGLTPTNLDRMEELAERGVMAFKAFMCPSGIDDFLWSDEDTLGRGMEIAARLGLPVGVHAEDPTITGDLARASIAAGRTSMRDYLASRPIKAEVKAIDTATRLAEQTGCSLHVVHVSSDDGVDTVAEAWRRGVDVTCETCPHYLFLTDEDAVRIGAAAKCAPPLRDEGGFLQNHLWDRGTIYFVASDHSPAPWSMKVSSDFFNVWGGIAGCQTLFGLMIESGLKNGIAPLVISELISTNPAKRFGLAGKGRIEVGCDADLVLVDLTKSHTLTADELLYRHKISPFVGRTLRGEVRRTLVRGRTLFADGQIVGKPAGRFIRPEKVPR